MKQFFVLGAPEFLEGKLVNPWINCVFQKCLSKR